MSRRPPAENHRGVAAEPTGATNGRSARALGGGNASRSYVGRVEKRTRCASGARNFLAAEIGLPVVIDLVDAGAEFVDNNGTGKVTGGNPLGLVVVAGVAVKEWPGATG